MSESDESVRKWRLRDMVAWRRRSAALAAFRVWFREIGRRRGNLARQIGGNGGAREELRDLARLMAGELEAAGLMCRRKHDE